jgi:hypothetical protein
MEEWKWILSAIPDDKLVDIVLLINKNRTPRRRIAISGFDSLSRIKNDPKQLKLIRKPLERTLLKPPNILEIQQILKRLVKLDEAQVSLIRAHEASELYGKIKSGELAKEPIEVLTWLLTSGEEDLKAKAVRFYELIRSDDDATAQDEAGQPDDPGEANPRAEEAASQQTAASPDDGAERWQAELAALSEENARLKDEVRAIGKRIARLEQELKETRKQKDRFEKEAEQRRSEVSDRDKKISQLIDQLTEAERVNQDQQRKLMRLNQELETTRTELNNYKTEIAGLSATLNEQRTQVVLIDHHRKELNALSDKRYIITLVSPGDLDQTVMLDHAEQIWFTSFRIPPHMKINLKQRYGNKIIEFDNYNKLRDYCNAGTV